MFLKVVISHAHCLIISHEYQLLTSYETPFHSISSHVDSDGETDGVHPLLVHPNPTRDTSEHGAQAKFTVASLERAAVRTAGVMILRIAGVPLVRASHPRVLARAAKDVPAQASHPRALASLARKRCFSY